MSRQVKSWYRKAAVMDHKKKTIEYYASHRLYGSNNSCNDYRAVYMDEQTILDRRRYMRQMLLGTSFANPSNELLDAYTIDTLSNADGVLLEDEEGRPYLINVDKVARDKEYRRSRALIPAKYEYSYLSSFNFNAYGTDTDDLKATIMKYLSSFEMFKNEGMGLYIHSDTRGTGKTLLSCALANELTERYAINVKFITIYDLLELTKKSYKTETEELKSITNAQVLILDDIGSNMAKEWVNSVLFGLVDKRYTSYKTTIYTSNLPPSKLNIDSRITDRIKERSYILHLPEKSIRQERAAQKQAELLKKASIDVATSKDAHR